METSQGAILNSMAGLSKCTKLEEMTASLSY